MSDPTYQTNVYDEQGGDRLVVRDGGYLQFFETDFTAKELRNLARQTRSIVIGNSAGVLSGAAQPVLPSEYGLIILSLAPAASNASARMFSCLSGQQVIIVGRGDASVASCYIYFSGHASGINSAGLIGPYSGAASGIHFQWSAAGSSPMVHLIAGPDGNWAVAEWHGLVTFATS